MKNPKIKHISKNGAGKITSKVTKPKDWAFRTPSEGRPKSVISRRAKVIPMEEFFMHPRSARDFLFNSLAGTKECEWNISCEAPARNLTPEDVLTCIHKFGVCPHPIEAKQNRDKKIFIFVDLSDFLTGTRDPVPPPALTPKEVELGKHHVTSLELKGKEKKKCKK